MLVSHRNRIEDGDLVLSILDDPQEFECCKILDCGDDDLNDFFISDALPHKNELLATTYCLTVKKAAGKKSSPPVAFITFSNDTVRTTKIKNFTIFQSYLSETIPEEKHYPFLPAVKIGRLAVHKDYQGHNFGTYLLNLTKRLFLSGNRTGCRFITVDAYKDQTQLSLGLRFDRNVGSMRLLSRELDMSAQGVRVALAKLGRMDGRHGGGDKGASMRRYKAFVAERGMD